MASLSEPDTKSRAAGHFYLSKYKDEIIKNGASMTLLKIIKTCIIVRIRNQDSSHCKAALLLGFSLEEMGHS